MIKKLFLNRAFKTSFLLISAIWLFFNANPTFACVIESIVLGEEKGIYKVDDLIDIKLTVTMTCGGCPIPIEYYVYDTNGLEIIKEAEWKEIRRGRVYEREVKLKVIGNQEGKLAFSFRRPCGRGGGFTSINLNSEQIE